MKPPPPNAAQTPPWVLLRTYVRAEGIVETNSRKLLKMLQDDGWEVVRIKGDHHIPKHPASVPAPKFASFRGECSANFGAERTLENLWF